jgi:hypothetical protein
MTQKAPAQEVISEMIASVFPEADDSAVVEAAASVISIGMEREPTAADAERFVLQHGEALAGTHRVSGRSTGGAATEGPRSGGGVTVRKSSRLTGAARTKLAADLKKKYDNGASIRELAQETGRSYGFVHRMLSEAGTTLRGRRGGASRHKDAIAEES